MTSCAAGISLITHRLYGVAGIERPLERVDRDDLDDLSDVEHDANCGAIGIDYSWSAAMPVASLR